MADKKPVALIGRLAIQLKMIDMSQLTEATAAQAATGVRALLVSSTEPP